MTASECLIPTLQDRSEEELSAIADLATAIAEITLELQEFGLSGVDLREALEEASTTACADDSSAAGLSAAAAAASAFAARYADLPPAANLVCAGPSRICGAPAELCCSACRARTYCSKKCQRKHWVVEHKYERKGLRPSGDSAAAGGGAASR